MSGDRLWKRKIPVKGSAEADFLLHSSATEQKIAVGRFLKSNFAAQIAIAKHVLQQIGCLGLLHKCKTDLIQMQFSALKVLLMSSRSLFQIVKGTLLDEICFNKMVHFFNCLDFYSENRLIADFYFE